MSEHDLSGDEHDTTDNQSEMERELLGTDEQGDTTGQPAADAPADGEGSSASQTQEGPKDLLSVVRDAAPGKPKTEGPAAASSADGAEGQGAKPGKEGAPAEPKEDYSDVPFHKHPRFRQLLTERNGFKEDAGKFRQVDTFIRQNGMSNEEAANLLTVGAMAKTDPAKAWEHVKPWVENLLKACGEVLSPELLAAVQKGDMTEEAAYQVSRANASVASVRAAQAHAEQLRQTETQENADRDYRQAAVDWESDRRSKDPNFDAKLEPILREIAWRKSQGDVPKTPQEVTAQLQAVYKAVNAALTPPATPAPGARPAPQQRKALTPVAGGSVAGGNAKPKPSSMLEVVQQGQG